MADPRLVKLAQVLVHYSLDIQSGDTFLIRSPFVAAPLVREVYREALQAGAHVTTRFDMDEKMGNAATKTANLLSNKVV